MKIQKILRDERINIFGMTYGFLGLSQIPPQILLCKRKINKHLIDDEPFILYPKKTEPKYEKSPLGNRYSAFIEGREYKLQYLTMIDSIYFITVRQSIFEELYQQQYFPLWTPLTSFQYYKSNPRGYIILFRVFKFAEELDKKLITSSIGITGRTVTSQIQQVIEIKNPIPIMSTALFEKIKQKILTTINNHSRDSHIEFQTKRNFEDTGNPLVEIRDFEQRTTEILETQREAVIQSRIGQGKFRTDLLRYWACCAVTGCQATEILKASHIKPWRDSDNAERLDPFNGLLLIPNLDSAFDSGLISFSDEGVILISSQLSKEDAERLNIHPELKISTLTKEHCKYLAYHREYIFKN